MDAPWEQTLAADHQQAVNSLLEDFDDDDDVDDDEAFGGVMETTMEDFTDDFIPHSPPQQSSRRPGRRHHPSTGLSTGQTDEIGGDSDGGGSDEHQGTDKAKDRRERNKASAKASRRKRKAHLESLADTVTRLAEETDRERLLRAERAAVGMDQRRAELVAAARAALATAAADGASGAVRGVPRGTSGEGGEPKLSTAAAAAAALPGLIRERFSMAGMERRALLDFAFEHAAAVGAPHHQRLLVYLAEQPERFFAEATEKQGRPMTSTSSTSIDPAFDEEWGIPTRLGHSDGSAWEKPNLWHILSNELQMPEHSSSILRTILNTTHARDLATIRKFIRSNRALRAATSERATAAAAMSSSLHGCLSPAQELAFQDFLSRNAERIRRLMPSGSRSRSTDEQAAAAARAAQTQARGASTGSIEEEISAAVSVAQQAGLPMVAASPPPYT